VWLGVLGITVGGSSCYGPPSTESSEGSALVAQAPTIRITPSPATIPVDAEQQFSVSGLGRGVTPIWSVANASIASVSDTGLVTALAAGKTQVKVALPDGSASATANLTVSVAKLRAVAVSPTTKTLGLASKPFQFVASGKFSNGQSYPLSASTTEWASSDTAIASVSPSGQATPLSPGTVSIQATELKTRLSNATTLTVTGGKVLSVMVAPATGTVPLGLDLDMSATIMFGSQKPEKCAPGASPAPCSDLIWSSSNSTIASVSAPGVVSALQLGKVTITATDVASGVQGTATLTVTAPAANLAIDVEPSPETIPVGGSYTLTATGLEGSGRHRTRVTLVSTTWSSSKPAVATISAEGEVTGVSPGVATLTATDPSSGQQGGAMVTVQNLAPAALQITAANLNSFKGTFGLPQGVTQAFQATAFYGTGRKALAVDVTDQAAWKSSAPSIALVSNSVGSEGTVTTLGAGSTTLSAKFDGKTASVKLVVSKAALTAITVSPQTEDLPAGSTQQMTATGTFVTTAGGVSRHDVTQNVTWSSSSVAVTVSNAAGSEGLASAVHTGTATLTAIDAASGIRGVAWLTVTPASLVSLTITPPSPTVPDGLVQQFDATGTFSDSSTRNLTKTVVWTSTRTNVATISNTTANAGLATAKGVGSTNIGAYDPAAGISASDVTMKVVVVTLTGLTIAPSAATIVDGNTQQFNATGTYSDGIQKDVTTSVTWSVTAGTATISNAAGNQGLATANGAGTSQIEATDPATGLTATATLTVTNPVVTLTGLAITPSAATIANGSTQQFNATGTYSDGTQKDVTTSVTWSVVSGTATISNAAGSQGLATGNGAGTSQVEATDPTTGLTATATLTVSVVLVSIAVTPPSVTIPIGPTQSLAATGTYSDGTMKDLTNSVTWSASPSGIVYVDGVPPSAGQVTGTAAGTATVTATDPSTGISGSAVVTVTTGVLQRFTIYPTTVTLSVGQTVQFTAIGYYSDGSAFDITSTVNWSSFSPFIVSVSNSSGTAGLATALQIGTATIDAYDDVLDNEDDANVTVVP
jgi:trimeric autotransporter adhesin